MSNIVVFGDSTFAERLAKYILLENKDRLLCFTQEDAFCSRDTILSLPVVPLTALRNNIKAEFEIVLAVGYTQMNNLREKLYNMLVDAGFKIGKWISTNAMVYSNYIGEGTIVLPNVVIGPGCQIGKCNFFESSVSLSHDNKIGNFNFFSTGVVIGGSSEIKNHCFLGLNSTVKSGICLHDYTLLGAAANILKTTKEFEVYIGNPAKKMDHNSIEVKI